MIEDKRLIHLRKLSNVDFYMYKASLGNYFYMPMNPYEKRLTCKIHRTIDYIRGGYKIIYIAREEKLLGYGLILKGGGLNTFSKTKDVVFTSLYISPDERKNGYGNLLIEFLCSESEKAKCNKIYECIRSDNVPSIKAAERNGFVKISNANRTGLLKRFVIDSKGNYGIYEYKGQKVKGSI